jgi:Tol biopolymer transport system component
MRTRNRWLWLVAATALAGCSPAPTPLPSVAPTAGPTPPASVTPTAGRIVHDGLRPVVTGEPIDLASLSGRIVFDNFENVSAMALDGSRLVVVAGDPTGSEFDGAWAPGGDWVVYRDSTRGINVDDEVFIASADGSERRNLTNNPANDWGPDWSPDGSTIAFNSDRDGSPMSGYLVAPDGSNLRRIEIPTWFEYPSFSPDGRSIAFMGAVGGAYDIYTVDLATSAVTRLTSARGQDGWPAWSPDGRTIAFSSQRDDCVFAAASAECWTADEPGEHRDIWLVAPDGSDLRRVNGEIGQFVTWSPDGRYLLVSGRALTVVRPDGTGRTEVRTSSVPHALGGIPDWWGAPAAP